MVVLRRGDHWIIVHGGRTIDADFGSEEEAWEWADEHIDDPVFDAPNTRRPPLRYRRSPDNLWEPEVIRSLWVEGRGQILVVRAPEGRYLCQTGGRLAVGGEVFEIRGLEYSSENSGTGWRPGSRIGLVVSRIDD